MDKIELQKKTKAGNGKIEFYFFENEHIGLKKTLFHRIIVPLEEFYSGLDYESQPTKTEIVFNWYELGLADPEAIQYLDLNHENYPEAEASVYVGNAHNWCNVLKLKLSQISSEQYNISGKIVVEFENEGIAENEGFAFETSAMLVHA